MLLDGRRASLGLRLLFSLTLPRAAVRRVRMVCSAGPGTRHFVDFSA
jgi:hypothetical protein